VTSLAITSTVSNSSPTYTHGITMKQRHIGRTGLRVSTVGMGGNNFGWKIDQEASNAVVSKALDLGITLFDTADRYGNTAGESEIVLSKALGERRKDIVLLTKFGVDLVDYSRNSSRSYVLNAVEGSLRRLNTDWIDIYMIHWPDYATPIEETLRALEVLVRSGKVRYIACSNLEPWRIADATWIAKQANLPLFCCAQDHYSLLHRNAEKELIPALEHYGIGLSPYYPLASGLLTGKYSGGAKPGEGRLTENFLRLGNQFINEKNLAIVNALDAFSKERGHTLLELAVSWLLSKSIVPSVICGATKPEQVELNVQAAEWVLSSEELAEIDKITKPA
jgi:aryl-alcohol dehydrogenase-like predicted oxidoreductase